MAFRACLKGILLLLLVSCLHNASCERATRLDEDPLHVLILPGPSETSSIPLVRLAKQLLGRGHEVTIAVLEHVHEDVLLLSSDIFGAPLAMSRLEGVQDLHFVKVPLHGAQLRWAWDDPRGNPSLPVRELMTMEDLVLRSLVPLFAAEVRISVGAPVMPLDCVVADHLMWGGYDLADKLGIPCIANSAGSFLNPFRGSFSQPEFKLMAPMDVTRTAARINVYIRNWFDKFSWWYRYFASNMIRGAFQIEAYPSPDRAFAFHRVTMVNVPVGVEPVKRLVNTQVQRIGHDRHAPKRLSSRIEGWLAQDPNKPALFVSYLVHRQAPWPAEALMDVEQQLAMSIARFTPAYYRVLWNIGPLLTPSEHIEKALEHLDVMLVSLNTTAEELDVIFDPRISALMSDGRISSLTGATESATPVLCAPCCAPEFFHNCVSSATVRSSLLVNHAFSEQDFALLERLNLHDNQVTALHIGDSGAAAELVELVTRVGEHHYLPLDVVHLHWLFQQTFFDVWFVVLFLTLLAGWLSYATTRKGLVFGRFVWAIFLEALGEPLDDSKLKND